MKRIFTVILGVMGIIGITAQDRDINMNKWWDSVRTNSIITMSTNDPGVWEHISREDMARQLIADGTVCKVHGHIWSTLVPQIVSIPAVNPPPPLDSYPQVRKCSLCGIEQTRTWTEWK